jgi:hypothetical protein
MIKVANVNTGINVSAYAPMYVGYLDHEHVGNLLAWPPQCTTQFYISKVCLLKFYNPFKYIVPNSMQMEYV